MAAFLKKIHIKDNIVNYNLLDDLTSSGWKKDSVNIEVVVEPGVIIRADSLSLPAFDVPEFPTGSLITVINHGVIIGWYDKNGPTSGPAFRADHPTIIDNKGVISAGRGSAGASSSQVCVIGNKNIVWANKGNLYGIVGF